LRARGGFHGAIAHALTVAAIAVPLREAAARR